MTQLIVNNPGEEPIVLADVDSRELICFCCMFPVTFTVGGMQKFDNLDAGMDGLPDWFDTEFADLKFAVELALQSITPGGYITFRYVE